MAGNLQTEWHQIKSSFICRQLHLRQFWRNSLIVKPLQHPLEIAAFAKLLADAGVKSFLEIGSKYGGSLRVITEALPKSSRVVSVDLGRNGPALGETISELKQAGYDARPITGNSTHDNTVNAARALGPYDAVFIDGDHRMPGLEADWNNYGPMGKIIGFHDIAWKRDAGWPGPQILVPGFWDSLKIRYRHTEIKMCETGCNAGIGVLWRN